MCVHLSFPSALSPVCGSGPTSSFVSPVCLRGRPATGRTTRGARTLGPVELFRRPASARCCTVLHNTELFPTLVLYPFGKGLSRPGYAFGARPPHPRRPASSAARGYPCKEGGIPSASKKPGTFRKTIRILGDRGPCGAFLCWT